MSLLLLLGNASQSVVVNKLARFNGSTDYATIPSYTLTGSAATFLIRCKMDVATPADWANTGIASLTDPDATHYPFPNGLAYVALLRNTRVNGIVLSGSVDRDAWHWLICRSDAGNGWELIQALDNGTLYSVSTQTHEAFATTQNAAFIGGYPDGSTLFDGDIDRMLLFNSRLNDGDIQAIIAGGNGASPVFRYEFSSNAGGVFADSSGNGRHATISGSPAIIAE